MKERRAYIVLVAISVLLSLAVLFLGTKAINYNNHKFCAFAESITVEKVSPPPANATRQQRDAYHEYTSLIKLEHDLHC